MREARRLQFEEEESRDYFIGQLERSVSVMSAYIEWAVAAGAIRPLPVCLLAYAILVGPTNYVAAQEAAGWPEDSAAAGEAAGFLTTLLMEGLQPGG